jgi:hypothetical protein
MPTSTIIYITLGAILFVILVGVVALLIVCTPLGLLGAITSICCCRRHLKNQTRVIHIIDQSEFSDEKRNGSD